ncbi:MAG TPA: AMP-binding protein, partial [Candidatus Binatia bacterium]|nr:AMP-binding protein [Candidatus Binatia bacterium]
MPTERVWLKEYQPGVPHDIDLTAYESLSDLIERSIGRFRALPAYQSGDTVLAYDDMDRLSQDFASYLQNVAGLEKGDRVAVMMPNLLQYPVVLFGILRAGMVVVNVNPLYTARELEHQLTDSGAKAIVIFENFAHTLEHVIDKTQIEHVILTGVGDQLNFPKSVLANLVLRYVRKQVPSYNLPNAVRFN